MFIVPLHQILKAPRASYADVHDGREMVAFALLKKC